MEQKVCSKHITVETCSLTNCTEAITNRLKQNKERRHNPRRPPGQKETNKTYSLATNPQKSNGTELRNTQSQSKSCPACNCRRKWNNSKTIAYLQKKEQSTQPHNGNFSSSIRKRSPGCRQTVCNSFLERKAFSFIFVTPKCSSTPFHLNTFQSLSIPKIDNRFTKSRKSTIPRKCARMIGRMVSSQNQNGNSNSLEPNIHTQNRSSKWQMQTHQRHTLPSLNCRSNKKNKSCIHSLKKKENTNDRA